MSSKANREGEASYLEFRSFSEEEIMGLNSALYSGVSGLTAYSNDFRHWQQHRQRQYHRF